MYLILRFWSTNIYLFKISRNFGIDLVADILLHGMYLIEGLLVDLGPLVHAPLGGIANLPLLGHLCSLGNEPKGFFFVLTNLD